MNEKVLVKVISSDVEETFDLFVPVNEYIWKIKKLMIKAISDLTMISLDMEEEYILINKDTSEICDDNGVIINTSIRNGTELILLKRN